MKWPPDLTGRLPISLDTNCQVLFMAVISPISRHVMSCHVVTCHVISVPFKFLLHAWFIGSSEYGSEPLLQGCDFSVDRWISVFFMLSIFTLGMFNIQKD